MDLSMDWQNGSASCVLVLCYHKDLMYFMAFHSRSFVAVLTEDIIISKHCIGGFIWCSNEHQMQPVQPPPRTGLMQGNPAMWHHSWSNHVITSCVLLNLSHWANSFVPRRWHVLAFSCWPAWLLSNSLSPASVMNTVQLTWNQFSGKINEK